MSAITSPVIAEFPDPSELVDIVSEREVDANLTVRMVVDSLLASREDVTRFEDSDALGLEMYEHPGSPADRFGTQLEAIRNQLADELWRRQIFISVEILDELLFQAIAFEAAPADPLLVVLKKLAGGVTAADTLVVFPLHSFGIHLNDLHERHIALVREEWDLALSSQSNNLGRTIEMLDQICERFGLNGDAPADLIEHWHRSRGASWLHANPLLIARVTALSGSYYSNEPLLMSRLQVSAALIAMASTFHSLDGDPRPAYLSSRSLNNFQTLDIRHYMLLTPGQHESNNSFVPISGLRTDVVEMSNLNLILDPDLWRAEDPRAAQLYNRLEAVYRGYLSHALNPDLQDSRASTYRKVFASLNLFKRSFSPDQWQATVTLATAFEQLLVHGEIKNLTSRVKKRMTKLLGTTGEASAHVEAFERLYQARCEILHQGRQRANYDIGAARRAFVASFVATAPLLDQVEPHRRRSFLELLDRA
jgi:hypothetical protein